MSIARLDQDQKDRTTRTPRKPSSKRKHRSRKDKALHALKHGVLTPYKATKSAATHTAHVVVHTLAPARPVLATLGAYLTLVALALALLVSLGIAGVLIVGIALLLLSAVPAIAAVPAPTA